VSGTRRSELVETGERPVGMRDGHATETSIDDVRDPLGELAKLPELLRKP
jgi:hypothetical protein